MAFIPALIAGISGVAGGLLNRPKTTTQGGTGTTNQNSSVTPTYDPQQLQMRNYLLNQFQNQSQNIPGMVNSYVSGGTTAINQGAQTNQQAMSARLASSGLSFSPAAAFGQQNADANRVNQITQLRSQAPLIQGQLQNQYLTSFGDFLSRLPTGSSSTGTQSTTQNGTITQPGNILGGAVSGLGSSLALLYGMGAFGNKKPGAAPAANPGAGIQM